MSDLREAPEENLVKAGYTELFNVHTSYSKAVDDFKEALRQDPASPFRWTDLGRGFSEGGNSFEAHHCFAQAIRLGPRIPAVLLRAAFFYLEEGETNKALTEMRSVLSETAEYDDIIFVYYNQLGVSHQYILRFGIPVDDRAVVSYARHLQEFGEANKMLELLTWAKAQNLAGEEVNSLYRCVTSHRNSK